MARFRKAHMRAFCYNIRDMRCVPFHTYACIYL